MEMKLRDLVQEGQEVLAMRPDDPGWDPTIRIWYPTAEGGHDRETTIDVFTEVDEGEGGWFIIHASQPDVMFRQTR